MVCCVLHYWILEDGPDEYVFDDASWYAALLWSARNRNDLHQENVAWAHKRDDIAQNMWKDKIGPAIASIEVVPYFYV